VYGRPPRNPVTITGLSPLYLLDNGHAPLQGILAFGLLASTTLIDIEPKASRVVPFPAVGLLGTFLVTFRLAVIFSGFDLLGPGFGKAMHAYVG